MQDLLENIRIGKYYVESKRIADIKSKIYYPYNISRKVIEKYLPLLSAESLFLPALRKDRFHLMKEAIDLKEVAMVLAHAQKKIFLTSFKHETKILDHLSPFVLEIYATLAKLIYEPSLATYEKLNREIISFKQELKNEALISA
ncbi:MAG: hypothetical protein H6626_10760 [Pseudobdellovibrionaceae bacterium]|nr:hypothetical protein [Bdellovibrionales bacterium]USN46685.1 MAG: hypothetical protein H6626_10760 [Pseudobdellovibrionaceae bacterium]